MIEVKQLINVDINILNTITTWMYNWWGKDEGYSFDGIKCFMKHSMQENKLPQTYGLFLDNKIIGMYQFTLEDLDVRTDIYPWLANVYIDENYRKQGYGKILLESVMRNVKNIRNFKEIYLFTKHINLFEKFGFEFVELIDTYSDFDRIQRLYKLRIR
ncbi:MAG: GNAT family N-acetyltransferase [Bacilli bacterium]|nr:GNAT family N-acetyltransferase [Bacilli bacterium]